MKKSIEITDPRYPAARESQGKLTGTLTEGERRKVVWERACRKVVHALHGMSDMKKDLNFSNEPSHSRIKLVIVTLAIHRMHCIISVYNNTRRHFILRKALRCNWIEIRRKFFVIYDVCFDTEIIENCKKHKKQSITLLTRI